MGQEFVRRRVTCSAKVGDGVGHVGRVPPDYGGGHQVQAGGAILLNITGPVGDAALAEGANCLCQCVPLLAFVESCLTTPAQSRIFQPVEHE